MPVSAHLTDDLAGVEESSREDSERGLAHIEELRRRLDCIDESILGLLRDRMRCCEDIARTKREVDVPMMQPHRIAHVHRRAATYGAANDVDPHFLRRLYDLIITETCRREALIMDEAV